jgi:REP element-mobilizing transposase RayT
MPYYERHLPHWHPDDAVLFVTWRLAGSSPRPEPEFLRMPFKEREAQLDQAAAGPIWLSDSRIASLVQAAIIYGANVRKLYDLYAWCIMPNHVHLVLQPHSPLPKTMQWLKARTARRANDILGRAGHPFWQEESYDRWMRGEQELLDTIAYVEENPLNAGLVSAPEDWPYSSARRTDDRNRSSVLLGT